MTARNLQSIALSGLVDQFVQLALAKGEAIRGSDVARTTRIYWKIDAINNELKSRKGDQRGILRSLFDYPDDSVRLEAAAATMTLFKNEARAVLKSVYEDGELPVSAHAGMMLLD